ncbi:hypothetical protein HW555_012894 [Spodoptera exigua]|uniref:DDE Tnp4 domain-containing protein n=1 Tax=Spodoptera exigua TaxID=7107 RepID=A0A835G4M6_SPOEX|nr:hypothetical protein HW555_012894 [Spodoptera exigua]
MPNRKVVIAGAAFIFMYLLTEDRKSRKRRWWKTNLYKRRSSLLVELKSQHISGQYKNFTRMSPTDFEYLLTIIAPKISRQDTIMRSAISPQDRLALTLRFLATGDSFTSLQYTFRISKQSMSCIVPEVCEAIIKALKENIKETELYKKLGNNSLRLPAPEALQGRNKVVPYVFVGDSAFPLQNNIMKPYPGEYPKDRREEFLITASVFRVLRKPMLLQPKTVETIVMAIAHLHNFLRNTDSSKNLYAPLAHLTATKTEDYVKVVGGEIVKCHLYFH